MCWYLVMVLIVFGCGGLIKLISLRRVNFFLILVGLSVFCLFGICFVVKVRICCF